MSCQNNGFDFAKLSQTYDNWWHHKADRALISLTFSGRDPQRPKPKAPLLTQENVHDFSIDPEDIAEAIEYHVSTYEYVGAAFPGFNLDCFGPGIAAALLGAKLDNHTGQVWFFPVQERPLEELTFKYNPDNPWMHRIRDIYSAANNRFGGQILMGLPDVGGVLDVMQVFRPGDKLLYDLYDSPEEVKRLIKELDQALFEMWQDFSEVCGCARYGYHDWTKVYAKESFSVIQSDFSFMISNEMFAEFALDSIKRQCRQTAHTLYHLDGPGCLKHLPLLLTIDELDAIQWIPGEGQPNVDAYLDTYEAILDAGKLIQLPNHGLQAVKKAISAFQNQGSFHVMPMEFTWDRKKEVLMFLDELL